MTPKRSRLFRHFSKLTDPRRDQKKAKHKLLEVIVIAVYAWLCGIDEFEGMAVWAKSKEASAAHSLTVSVPSTSVKANRRVARQDSTFDAVARAGYVPGDHDTSAF